MASQGHRLYTPFLSGLVLGFTLAALFTTPLTRNLAFRSQRSQENFVPASPVGSHNDTDFLHDMTDDSVAKALFDKVRVLCWVLTAPKNHESKAKHVKATWGRRCNHLIFMSTKEDDDLPAVALPVAEGRDHLWAKTKEAMKYVYRHYYDKAEWFFKADDDTYAVLENMRHMLYFHNSTEPVYFGCKFKPFVSQGYMSGGAGYVLSKEALRRFVKDALPDATKCKQEDTGAEDVEMGKCLEGVGVRAGDSRDPEGRHRFVPLFVLNLLIPGYYGRDFWYWDYIYYPQKEGMECCSDGLITTHYVSPNNMYLMEYLLYHAKPFGIAFNPKLQERSSTGVAGIRFGS